MGSELFAVANFGDLLRRLLVHEKQRPVVQVAEALHLAPSRLYAKMRGSRFSPDEIAVLLREVPDARLPKWLMAGTGLLVVVCAPPDAAAMVALHQGIVTGVQEAVAALSELVDALEHSRLGNSRKGAIEEHVDHAQAELLRIRLAIAAEHTPAPRVGGAGSPDGFLPRMREVLLTEKGIRLQDVADALDISYSATHARMAGAVPFTPAELRRLFQMYPEPRVADCLLRGSSFVAIPRPPVINSPLDYSPLRSGLLSLVAMSHVLGALIRVSAAGIPMDRTVVAEGVDEALRHLTVLHWNINYVGPPKAGVSRTAGAALVC